MQVHRQTHVDSGGKGSSIDTSAAARRHARTTTRLFYAMTFAYAMGWMLVRQATDQMWLQLSRGDTARTAIVRGRLDSARSVLTFVAIPVIAGCSDAFGRKLILSLGAWSLLAVNGLVLIAPPGPRAVVLLAVREMLLPIAMSLVDIPRLASLGDMYSGDSIALTEATAFNSAIFPMCKIVGPLLGGLLVARGGLRAPFWASTLCMSRRPLVASSAYAAAARDLACGRWRWRWRRLQAPAAAVAPQLSSRVSGALSPGSHRRDAGSDDNALLRVRNRRPASECAWGC
jgi:MFS family permease